jgi:hypothetical protein
MTNPLTPSAKLYAEIRRLKDDNNELKQHAPQAETPMKRRRGNNGKVINNIKIGTIVINENYKDVAVDGGGPSDHKVVLNWNGMSKNSLVIVSKALRLNFFLIDTNKRIIKLLILYTSVARAANN